MLSIYSYTNPADYLTDAFEQKRKKNPSFSLRSWAQSLGMKSHGPLHAMLKGQRNIPKKYVPLFIKSFKLEKKEATYFEVLVDFQRAKSIEEKEMYDKRLKELSPKERLEVSEIEAYKYISEPLHVIIAEMTQLKDFKPNIGWIKNHLRLQMNMKEGEEVLERLESLGILKKIKDGYEKKMLHTSTAEDVINEAIQINHKKMCAVASEQISKQDVENREYSAVTFNIKKKDLKEIKESIREFTDELIRQYEAEGGEGEETYQLNTHFFSLSKS